MTNQNRFFEVTHTKKWIETKLDYQKAGSHKEVAEILSKKSIRVMNERFREIETTGEYYRITEVCKGGKTIIFEIIEQ